MSCWILLCVYGGGVGVFFAIIFDIDYNNNNNNKNNAHDDEDYDDVFDEHSQTLTWDQNNYLSECHDDNRICPVNDNYH